MKSLNSICTLIILGALISCSGKEGKNSNKNEDSVAIINSDSVELTNLLRQAYTWHIEETLDEFPYKYQDSIFTGIDWEKYQQNIEIFKKTNFFSQNFFKKHNDIALTLDSSIGKSDIYWRNMNDGIPIWATEVDDWCNCQDYPNDYWETLIIDSLIINEESAIFKWTWDKEYRGHYEVTAKKEEGKWKINSLEGFNNYHTVDHYDKIMNDK